MWNYRIVKVNLLGFFVVVVVWIFLRAVIYRLKTRRWGQTPIPNSVKSASPVILRVLREVYLKQ